MEKGLLIWKEAPSFKNPLPNPQVTVMAWLSSPQKALFSRDFCVILGISSRFKYWPRFSRGSSLSYGVILFLSLFLVNDL